MPLSTKARHYLESLWGERLRDLIKHRDFELERIRQGLIHPADIYAGRVGFWTYLQPDLDHVSEIGKIRADCALKAYSFDTQSLSLKVIGEILLDASLNMESAAATLIAAKRNEIQDAYSNPALREPAVPDHSEWESRFLAIQHETKQRLERQLTIRMYESENENLRAEVTQFGGARKMPRTAVVLNVLIASPSDVNEERNIVADAVHSWNAAHFPTTGIMLQPVRWETHSFPASGDRPQAIINRQIADEGDLLIGIFGTRLGTPTGEAQSGTIEEIERFRKAGKHVALYFSNADVPRDADRNQLTALENYQRERQKDTLYATFTTPAELGQLVSQHLPMIVSEVYKKLRLSRALDGLEQDLRDARLHSEERLSELAASQTGESFALRGTDPCVDVELSQEKTSLGLKTAFVLTNNGGGVARNVQLQPIRLHRGTVTFECLGALPAGEKRDVKPHLEAHGVVSPWDVVRLFNLEWDTVGKESGTIPEELIISVGITYANYRGDAFETTADIVFFGVREHLQRNSSFSDHQTIISIRNVRSGRTATLSPS